MTYDTPGNNKNFGGIAFIAFAHIAAAVLIVNNSTILIDRKPPMVEIDIKRELIEPKVEQKAVEFPDQALPFVKPLIIEDHFPIEIKQETVTPTNNKQVDVERGGGEQGGGKGGGGGGGGVLHNPVTIPAEINAKACAKPEYPKNSLRNGDSGAVTLAFLIGTDGRVAKARVEKSSGFRELDRAAQAGLSLCQFKPGTVDGVAFESWTQMQYVWSLDE